MNVENIALNSQWRRCGGGNCGVRRRAQAVQAALDSLMTGRTVVVVAHRLSTIRNAGRIVVFRRGAVVEQGTHDRLLAAAGPYADLVSSQMAH